MDRIIAGWDGVQDDDLTITHDAAYQTDMSITADYDEDYFDKCDSYRGGEIAKAINKARCDLVNRYAGPDELVLDVGIGAGEFIQNRIGTYGYDINIKAVEWLKFHCLYSDKFRDFKALTFWDVIEHIPNPHEYFDQIETGSWLFTSIPVFDDLKRIRESKHYRPGEHLYYFTVEGFKYWMLMYGFVCYDENDHETQAGRDSIMSFALRKEIEDSEKFCNDRINEMTR